MPLSKWRETYGKYVQELKEKALTENTKQETREEIQIRRKLERKKELKESYERQVEEWSNPEIFRKNEEEFMKDPYKTVFIARLDYSLTELDISRNFSKYGVIDSVRIIRDRSLGKSRGYGFVVFERENDAKSCVKELAPTGLKIPTAGKTTRTIIVDIERGRVIRNWKPRRLGGGLGGRHYTKPNAVLSNNASAAASGRVNQYSHSFHKYGASHHQPQLRNYSSRHSSQKYNEEPSRHGPAPTAYSIDVADSYKNRYAKYSRPTASQAQTSYRSASSQSRSIRSIRQREN